MTLEEAMIQLLNNACSNPYYPPGFDYKAAQEAMNEYNSTAPNTRRKPYPDPPAGWHTYHIELHCKQYLIQARQVFDTWEVFSIEPITEVDDGSD